MLINKQVLSISIFIFSFLLYAAPVLAQDDGFNPNHIVDDDDILDSQTMSLDDIQNFLDEKNSFLADYLVGNASGFQKKASEIIYDAAVNNYDCSHVDNMSEYPTITEKKYKCSPIAINPKFLLVLLQKEQALIEKQNPEQGRLDWATGYGCPDSGGCKEKWKGFGKQVNSAALQFYDYVTRINLYTYKPGNLYTFTNPYAIDINKKDTLVTPDNAATAALYNYTPHVYNGNYNFYKIWNRYFPGELGPVLKPSLIEGSLVQVNGEAGVWLIKSGQRRPFINEEALTSRYDASKILKIEKNDLEPYPKGDPIKFPKYSLVRVPDNTIYLLADDRKRKVENIEVINKIGLSLKDLIDIELEDIEFYKKGDPVTMGSKQPIGALLQDKETGGVYWAFAGEKAPILDAVFLKTKFKDYDIVKTDKLELGRYVTIDPVLFDDGELVKSSNSNSVYVISEGKKRSIKSEEAFNRIGYNWNNIITVSPKVLYLYNNGEDIQ